MAGAQSYPTTILPPEGDAFGASPSHADVSHFSPAHQMAAAAGRMPRQKAGGQMNKSKKLVPGVRESIEMCVNLSDQCLTAHVFTLACFPAGDDEGVMSGG